MDLNLFLYRIHRFDDMLIAAMYFGLFLLLSVVLGFLLIEGEIIAVALVTIGGIVFILYRLIPIIQNLFMRLVL